MGDDLFNFFEKPSDSKQQSQRKDKPVRKTQSKSRAKIDSDDDDAFDFFATSRNVKEKIPPPLSTQEAKLKPKPSQEELARNRKVRKETNALEDIGDIFSKGTGEERKEKKEKKREASDQKPRQEKGESRKSTKPSRPDLKGAFSEDDIPDSDNIPPPPISSAASKTLPHQNSKISGPLPSSSSELPKTTSNLQLPKTTSRSQLPKATPSTLSTLSTQFPALPKSRPPPSGPPQSAPSLPPQKTSSVKSSRSANNRAKGESDSTSVTSDNSNKKKLGSMVSTKRVNSTETLASSSPPPPNLMQNEQTQIQTLKSKFPTKLFASKSITFDKSQDMDEKDSQTTSDQHVKTVAKEKKREFADKLRFKFKNRTESLEENDEKVIVNDLPSKKKQKNGQETKVLEATAAPSIGLQKFLQEASKKDLQETSPPIPQKKAAKNLPLKSSSSIKKSKPGSKPEAPDEKIPVFLQKIREQQNLSSDQPKKREDFLKKFEQVSKSVSMLVPEETGHSKKHGTQENVVDFLREATTALGDVYGGHESNSEDDEDNETNDQHSVNRRSAKNLDPQKVAQAAHAAGAIGISRALAEESQDLITAKLLADSLVEYILGLSGRTQVRDHNTVLQALETMPESTSRAKRRDIFLDTSALVYLLKLLVHTNPADVILSGIRACAVVVYGSRSSQKVRQLIDPTDESNVMYRLAAAASICLLSQTDEYSNLYSIIILDNLTTSRNDLPIWADSLLQWGVHKSLLRAFNLHQQNLLIQKFGMSFCKNLSSTDHENEEDNTGDDEENSDDEKSLDEENVDQYHSIKNGKDEKSEAESKQRAKAKHWIDEVTKINCPVHVVPCRNIVKIKNNLKIHHQSIELLHLFASGAGLSADRRRTIMIQQTEAHRVLLNVIIEKLNITDAPFRDMNNLDSEADIFYKSLMILEFFSQGRTRAAEKRRKALINANMHTIMSDVMNAHKKVADIEMTACRILGNICLGSEKESYQCRSAIHQISGFNLVMAAMKRHNSDLQLQKIGMFALSSMSLGDNEASDQIREDILNAGAHTVVCTSLKLNASVAEIQEAGLAALKNFALTNKLKGKLLTSNAHKLICQGMTAHTTNPRVQEIGMLALRSFLVISSRGRKGLVEFEATEQVRSILIDSGIVDTTLRGIEENFHDAAVLTACFSVFAGLCMGQGEIIDRTRADFRNENIQKILIHGMSTFPLHAHMQQSAMELVRYWAGSADEEKDKIRDLLVDLELHKLICEGLKNHPSNIAIQTAGMSALRNLSYGFNGDDRRNRIIEDEGALWIQVGLRAHAEVPERQVEKIVLMFEAGIGALRNLSFGNDAHSEDRRQHLIDHNGHKIIFAALKALETYEQVQEVGLLALANLAKGNSYIAEVRRWEMVRANALDLIYPALTLFETKEHIQQSGLVALGNLATGLGERAEDNRFLMLKKNCHRLVLKALNAFPESLQVIQAGIVCLSNLSQGLGNHSDECRIAIADNAGHELVYSLIKKNLNNTQLLEVGLAFFQNFSVGRNECDANRDLLIDAGVHLFIVDQLKTHSEEAGIQGHGIAALANISMGDERFAEERRNQIMECHGLDCVLQAMTNFPDSLLIQKVSLKLLGNLALESTNTYLRNDRRKLLLDNDVHNIICNAMQMHEDSVPIQEAGHAALFNIGHSNRAYKSQVNRAKRKFNVPSLLTIAFRKTDHSRAKMKAKSIFTKKSRPLFMSSSNSADEEVSDIKKSKKKVVEKGGGSGGGFFSSFGKRPKAETIVLQSYKEKTGLSNRATQDIAAQYDEVVQSPGAATQRQITRKQSRAQRFQQATL